MSIQNACPCQLVRSASKLFVVIHYHVLCKKCYKIHIFMYSVLLFTVYTDGEYIEVLDKLAEDTMNHAVEEVKASLE